MANELNESSIQTWWSISRMVLYHTQLEFLMEHFGGHIVLLIHIFLLLKIGMDLFLYERTKITVKYISSKREMDALDLCNIFHTAFCKLLNK